MWDKSGSEFHFLVIIVLFLHGHFVDLHEFVIIEDILTPILFVSVRLLLT